jgi:nitroreductase
MSPDELLNLIIKRRSIRKWLDKPVEEEKVSKILTAGIYAPSAANCQKVKFFVIQDKEMINVVCNNTSDWFKKIFPNKIILVLFDLAKKDTLQINYRKPHEYWSRFIWQDSAAAMMNMMLMAESLDLNSCWVSVRPDNNGKFEKNIREALRLANRYVMTSFLFLGYSDSKIDLDTYMHQGSPIKRDEKGCVLKKIYSIQDYSAKAGDDFFETGSGSYVLQQKLNNMQKFRLYHIGRSLIYSVRKLLGRK